MLHIRLELRALPARDSLYGTTSLLRAFVWGFVSMSLATPIVAQAPSSSSTEQVSYWNQQDSTLLTAELTLPSGPGPHPGVVVLSTAGTEPLTEHLVDRGYVVLIPVLRGFVSVEPLLQATFSDLASDVLSALGYLASRTEVDGAALGLIAQGDHAPQGMLAAASSAEPVPLVLLAPPAFSGAESLRLEQRWLAEQPGAGTADLPALDRYIAQIAEIVLEERTPYMREFRLESLRAGSSVQLPRNNAQFPAGEDQMRFFASPLWYDKLAFEPHEVFSRLRSQVLVLIGESEAYTPLDAYLATVQRALSAGGSQDAAVCLIPGRTRHVFSDQSVSTISEWVGRRIVTGSDRPSENAAPPSRCLEDPGR